jgi:polysaccharide export outer membrane protein
MFNLNSSWCKIMKMNIVSFQRILTILLFIVAYAGINSCRVQKETNYKELLYLQGKLDTLPNYAYQTINYQIQSGDLLGIMVYSDNPEATSFYNQASGASAKTGSVNPGSSSMPTYQVNSKGTIYLQGLGEIQVAGKASDALSLELKNLFTKYLKNPFVDIRITNRSYTVMGEVTKPGIFPITNVNVNILQAIGAAGDLTVYGKKNNILVIREQNGVRSFGRIDLNRGDVFQSEYFVLRPNDVVYVEPNNKKSINNDQQTIRTISIIASITSILATLTIFASIFR